jgi:hypothetical protein
MSQRDHHPDPQAGLAGPGGGSGPLAGETVSCQWGSRRLWSDVRITPAEALTSQCDTKLAQQYFTGRLPNNLTG